MRRGKFLTSHQDQYYLSLNLKYNELVQKIEGIKQDISYVGTYKVPNIRKKPIGAFLAGIFSSFTDWLTGKRINSNPAVYGRHREAIGIGGTIKFHTPHWGGSGIYTLGILDNKGITELATVPAPGPQGKDVVTLTDEGKRLGWTYDFQTMTFSPPKALYEREEDSKNDEYRERDKVWPKQRIQSPKKCDQVKTITCSS